MSDDALMRWQRIFIQINIKNRNLRPPCKNKIHEEEEDEEKHATEHLFDPVINDDDFFL